MTIFFSAWLVLAITASVIILVDFTWNVLDTPPRQDAARRMAISSLSITALHFIVAMLLKYLPRYLVNVNAEVALFGVVFVFFSALFLCLPLNVMAIVSIIRVYSLKTKTILAFILLIVLWSFFFGVGQQALSSLRGAVEW